MKMTRHFFVSDKLDDLEHFEEELEHRGIVTPQIHLLTSDDLGAAHHHHLHAVPSFMKMDVIHSGLIGAGLGLCLALLVLLVAYTAGWSASLAGWTPFVCLAFVLFGFSTWQGGLWGIQTRNAHFRRFEQAMREGRHVLFVDAAPQHEAPLKEIAQHYGSAHLAGIERGTPSWLVFSQHRLAHFFTHTFP